MDVIFCEIPTSSKSIVPGALDETSGLPELTNFKSIEGLYLSPDGTQWMIKARTQQGNTEENILLRGGGTTVRHVHEASVEIVQHLPWVATDPPHGGGPKPRPGADPAN